MNWIYFDFDLFLGSNCRILAQITKIMYEKSFKKVDQIDCKIIALEVKKRALFTPCKTGSTNFESSWFTVLALQKVEAF
jgi:hypothetical protein